MCNLFDRKTVTVYNYLYYGQLTIINQKSIDLNE